MKTLTVLMLLFACSVLAQEPAPLTALRKQRDERINKGMQALYQKYLDDCLRLQKAYTLKGDLESAVAVRKEVEATREILAGFSSGGPATLPPSPGSSTSPALKPSTGPADGWTVIFKSADPKEWLSGKPSCPAAADIPDDFTYLRLRRMDTRDAVILPLRKDKLSESRRERDQQYWWHGDNRLDSGAYHLGIGNAEWKGERKAVVVTVSGGHARGWGFGHKAFVNDKQYFCWAGKEVRRSGLELEISVGKGPLSAIETQRQLLGAAGGSR